MDKTLIACSIIKSITEHSVNQILVVGCGNGQEAIILGSYFKCNSIGIDLNPDGFPNELPKNVTLLKADATNLPFENEIFDIVFSYHCIEHVSNYKLALVEMKRVLKTGGVFYIGTPNRQRIIGYVSDCSSLKEKFLWNYVDYKYRIKGKFRNEFGAHAGFSQNEFFAELKEVFCTVRNVTRLYFHELYYTKRIILLILEKTNLYKLLYPSIYFAGKK